MPPWTCPECHRQFGRKGQGHECAPAMPLEEYLASGPPHERPVVEAVLAFLEGAVGPVHVEPVSVGVFLKRASTFAELRPMTRWEQLGFSLDHRLDSPRLSRKSVAYGRRYWHHVRLHSPADLDDEVKEWLVESYLAAPE